MKNPPKFQCKYWFPLWCVDGNRFSKILIEGDHQNLLRVHCWHMSH